MSKLSKARHKSFEKNTRKPYSHNNGSGSTRFKHRTAGSTTKLPATPLISPTTFKACIYIIIIMTVLCSSYLIYQYTWPPFKNALYDTKDTMMRHSGLHIDTLMVEGRYHADPASVQKAIAYQKNDFIFDIQPQLVKQRLESLPWIRSATVQRQWPAMIYIRLIEQQPIAIWQKDQQYLLIDDCGTVILTKNFKPFKSLPVLTGDDAPRQAPAFLDVLQQFPRVRKQMSGATLVGKRRWDIIINDKITINLPEHDIQDELAYLSQLIDTNDLDHKNIISIDLRTPDRAYFYLSDSIVKNKAIKGSKRI